MAEHIPMRMCIACRAMHPQNEMLRFVRDIKDGMIKPDTDKSLFGRGAYICKNGKCIALAQKKNGLARHFKCEVPHTIYKTAEELI